MVHQLRATPIPRSYTLEVRCYTNNEGRVLDLLKMAGNAAKQLSSDEDRVDVALYSNDYFKGWQDIPVTPNDFPDYDVSG